MFKSMKHKSMKNQYIFMSKFYVKVYSVKNILLRQDTIIFVYLERISENQIVCDSLRNWTNTGNLKRQIV